MKTIPERLAALSEWYGEDLEVEPGAMGFLVEASGAAVCASLRSRVAHAAGRRCCVGGPCDQMAWGATEDEALRALEDCRLAVLGWQDDLRVSP